MLTQPYDMGTHYNRLTETIVMSNHSIGFRWEIKDLAIINHLLPNRRVVLISVLTRNYVPTYMLDSQI